MIRPALAICAFVAISCSSPSKTCAPCTPLPSAPRPTLATAELDASAPSMLEAEAPSVEDEDPARGYAFATCIEAAGIRAPAVEEAIGFYIEQADEFWKFEAIKQCARAFATSRQNRLGRDLAIPDCLAFLDSKELKAVRKMKEGNTQPDCRQTKKDSPTRRQLPTLE